MKREEDPLIVLNNQLDEAIDLLWGYVRLREEDKITPMTNALDEAIDKFLKAHG